VIDRLHLGDRGKRAAARLLEIEPVLEQLNEAAPDRRMARPG
jgi:hypothetical protein